MAPVAVGLTNQGATGYLNVGLQVLYHIPALRDAVLSLPLDEHSDPTRCPPLAWQRLFSRMRSGLRCAQPISTKEITQSMGWEGQHLNLAQVGVLHAASASGLATEHLSSAIPTYGSVANSVVVERHPCPASPVAIAVVSAAPVPHQ